MSVRTRSKSVFYIEQLILSDTDNPESWTQEKLEQLTKTNTIIGYLFSSRPSVSFGIPTKVLNLYLIRPKYHVCSEFDDVTLDNLREGWINYCLKVESIENTAKQMVFKNPPIKEWLDTKDNWVKKITNKTAQRFSMNHDDALSEVYYTICKLYNKKTVYMGNLCYVEKAIINNILMSIQYNKNRLNGNNCQSLDVNLSENEVDGGESTLHDIIGKDDPWIAEQEYTDFESSVYNKMSKVFSKREFEQIISNKGFLPNGLYRRLLKWRKATNIKTFMEDVLNG